MNVTIFGKRLEKSLSMDVDIFIDKSGKILKPNPSDPEWNSYISNIAQTALGTFKLFGVPDLESYKDYMGIVTVVINLFMLSTEEEKAKYLEYLISKYEQNKRDKDELHTKGK